MNIAICLWSTNQCKWDTIEMNLHELLFTIYHEEYDFVNVGAFPANT